jgi:hypothetical protein
VARRLLTNLDLVKNQIKNMEFDLVAADPASPGQGQVWFNTTTQRLKFYDGAKVVDVTLALTSNPLFLYQNFS